LHRATIVAANVGRAIAFLFILFGVWQVIQGNWGGLWTVLIGWFLESAANAQVQQQIAHEQLADYHTSQVMKKDFTYIPGDQVIQNIVDNYSGSYKQRYFLVQGEMGEVTGFVTWKDILAVPSQQWPHTTLSQITKPIDKVHSLEPQIDLWDALEIMETDGVQQLPVMEDDRLVGILSREGVFQFLRMLRNTGMVAS
jgi:predicted transcriptional regulator